MSDRGLSPLHYCAQPIDGVWRWSDDCSVVVWDAPDSPAADGATLAFREEVAEVLDAFDRGIPSIDAVVTILAACRAEWWRSHGSHAFAHHHETRGNVRWRDVRDGLNLVSELPSEQLEGIAAKRSVVTSILDESRCRGTSRQRGAIVDFLRSGARPDELRQTDGDGLDALHHGLRRFAVGAMTQPLQDRIETGLESLPRAADEVSISDQAHTLLRELSADPKHTGFARLVNDILAATSIPRHPIESDELPTGGVSDISNRGPVERLLISELANDIDTLSIRLALGEALYLRREAPPRDPPRARRILIDSGLRLWGVPRVFAAAVGLALVAEARETPDVVVERAGVNRTAVTLHTRQGLVAHLAALETTLDATETLPSFARSIDDDEEPIIVVHEHSLESAEFRAAMSSLPAGALVATVHESGRYRLLRLGSGASATARRPVPLCSAELDLSRILDPPESTPPTPPLTSPPLIDETHAIHYPKILRLDRLPIRIPTPLPWARSIATSRGAFAITKDGRLLHVDQPGVGAIELSHSVPRGDLLWLSLRHNEVRVIVHDRKEIKVLVHDLATNETRSHSYRAPHSVIAAEFRLRRHFGVLTSGQGRRLHVFDINATEPLASYPVGDALKPAPFPHAMYFETEAGTLGKMTDGSITTGWISEVGTIDAGDITTAFDSADSDWPWVVRSNGTMQQLDPQLGPREINAPWRVTWIARDGARVATNRVPAEVLDLETGRTQVVSGFREELTAALDPELYRYSNPPRVFRKKFYRIGTTPNGELLLVDASGLVHVVNRPDYQGGQPASDFPNASYADFEPCGDIPNGRVALKKAEFGVGNTAWLDHRGLLHLEGSVSGHEVTVALQSSLSCNSPLFGGWTDDGVTVGEQFTIDSEKADDPERMLDLIQMFVNTAW